jgi:hypothetical protein
MGPGPLHSHHIYFGYLVPSVPLAKENKLPRNMSVLWIAMFNPSYTCNHESTTESTADRA